MSVITTYLNDNAQTPLGRFVVYMLYSLLCNKYSDISNRWSLGLNLSVASSAVGAISNSPSSTTLLIVVNRVPWRIFYKSTVVHTKNVPCEQNHAPWSSETSPFDRVHMTSYSTLIETMRLSCTFFELLRVFSSKVANCNPPNLYLKFRRELWCQKTRVTGLSCVIICVILRLAVSIQYRSVTDTHTDTRRRHMPRLA